MSKRILSILLSAVMMVSVLPVSSISADAATSYATQLKNKGFPESYVSSLVELHKKYPNWKFEPVNTGLSWNEAVEGEHTPHTKQRIQKQSALNDGYYCGCSKCYVNGKYKIVEGSTWVAASEAAVKYYLDPRNWLDERYIYQFEDIRYSTAQTRAGVEGIIASTWMKDSYITYKDTNGELKTFRDDNGDRIRYSTAILRAAKQSGLSAYFIASKIVQEVGGAKNTAGGVSGTYSGYEGYYNYYNIAAYTGAKDGLKWASQGVTYKTNVSASLRKSPSTSSNKITVLSKGASLTFISPTEKQSDGYVWYKVKATQEGTTYTGYVRSDLVDIIYPTYNRPWTNPYVSIINGADYIANGYLPNQHTDYYQKFNVNPNSTNKFNHEYMANVQGAAAEARIAYNSQLKAGTLADEKVFYIPVFSSMPKNASPIPNQQALPSDPDVEEITTPTKVTGLKLTDRETEKLSYKWDAIKGATQYHIFITNVGRGTTFDKYVTTNYADLNGLTAGNQYSVTVRAYVKGWREFSSLATHKTRPEKVENLKVSSRASTSISLKWDKVDGADGYIIYRLIDGSYKSVKAVAGENTLSAKITGLAGYTSYRFKVAAYVDDKKTGAKSDSVLTKTKMPLVTGFKVSTTATTIKASWSKANGNASGYQVSFARDKEFKDKIATKTVVDKKVLSYTGRNLTKGRSYYVRVRTYYKTSSKTVYGAWTTPLKATCK